MTAFANSLQLHIWQWVIYQIDMNTPLDLTGFVSKHSPQPVDLTISPTKNNQTTLWT